MGWKPMPRKLTLDIGASAPKIAQMPTDPKRTEELLRALPAVQKLLDHADVQRLQREFGRDAVLSAARETLAALRTEIAGGSAPFNGSGGDAATQCVAQQIAARIEQRFSGGVQRVINATGVILHTGLGRAVLPAAAIREIEKHLAGFASVEVELESGGRGHRDLAVRDLVTTLLGCEHATVVNNNAAATMLALAALARGKEVIVSRGQLVEIGGSFRVPDVMKESGCRLVEVGTTNRTYVRDYEAAITSDTAALMLVHTSNFRLIGFTEEPAVRDLAALARKHNLPLLYDIGSGALLPGLADELSEEPVVKAALEDGADLVLFSADKILGSAQGGIAAGRKDLVEKLRKHPLYRAFRVDKLTLKVLETTLRLYLDPEKRAEQIPTLKMLKRTLASIGDEASALATAIARCGSGIEALCIEDSSRLGSGSLPERNIPTRLVTLRHAKLSADALGAKLRAHKPPIFTRIQDDRVCIDPRTLLAGDGEEIVRALSGLEKS
jgi:L-seryl-tRNA(Ser) seleniumtransferase